MPLLSLISCAFPLYGKYEEDNDHDGVRAFIFDVTGLSIPDDEEESVLSTVPGPFYLLISALLAPISKTIDKR